MHHRPLHASVLMHVHIHNVHIHYTALQSSDLLHFALLADVALLASSSQLLQVISSTRMELIIIECSKAQPAQASWDPLIMKSDEQSGHILM